MPLIWRGMRMTDERPEVGQGANSLGVRIGAGAHDDIREEDGQVQPNTGGMSVSPSLETMTPLRIPRRLREKFPERFPFAKGSNQLHYWSMGEGAFVAGPVAEKLVLRADTGVPVKHAVVEPEQMMPVADYEAAIAATQNQWRRWEE